MTVSLFCLLYWWILNCFFSISLSNTITSAGQDQIQKSTMVAMVKAVVATQRHPITLVHQLSEVKLQTWYTDGKVKIQKSSSLWEYFIYLFIYLLVFNLSEMVFSIRKCPYYYVLKISHIWFYFLNKRNYNMMVVLEKLTWVFQCFKRLIFFKLSNCLPLYTLLIFKLFLFFFVFLICIIKTYIIWLTIA